MAVSAILLEIINQGALVKGASTLDNYPDHIAIDSFSWSVNQDPSGAMGGTNKVKPQSIVVQKQFDRASTVLFAMMETDKPFEATFRYIDASVAIQGIKGADTVLEIKLKGCHIDSITLGATDAGKAVEMSETVTISFTESLTLTFRDYDAATKSRGKPMTSVVEPRGSEEN